MQSSDLETRITLEAFWILSAVTELEEPCNSFIRNFGGISEFLILKGSCAFYGFYSLGALGVY